MPRKVSDYRNPKNDADWNGVLTSPSRNRMTGTDATVADWPVTDEKGEMAVNAMSVSAQSHPQRRRGAEGG